MRVLHIMDHSLPLHSGYTFRTAAIVHAQRARGWETFHLTSPRQGVCGSDYEEVDGLGFFRTAAPAQTQRAMLREPVLMHALAQRIDQLVCRIAPDILHAHSPVLNALPALWASRRHNIPLVYEVRAFWEDAAVDHGSTHEGSVRYRATRVLETWALRRVDQVTTICEGLRSDMLARGIAADKITVIPNAVDTTSFAPGMGADAGLARYLGLADCTVLGFIGSFYAYEGLDLLLDALPDMLMHQPRLRVLLVGAGETERALRAQTVRLGITDRVIFAGRVPHAEIQRYYDLIDILVYPRHPMRLTELVTPLKPLEAMAQERLFVASDVGGHKELIRDGETGVLFRAGDARALADAVLRLLAGCESWPRLRANGRAFVERERTWAASVARYEPVYRQLMQGSPA